MSLGSNIRKRRFELNLSQQELADRMGYRSRSTIAKIESGENDVTQAKLRRLAQALDTTAEALMAFSDAAPLSAPASSSGTKARTVAVILAGGKSVRNLQNIPNQFISILGKPVIVYCLEAYQNHPAIDDIYVVCLKGWEEIVTAYAQQYRITKLRGLIPGGSSGILSVKNGLDYVLPRYQGSDIIVFQESTRPMVRAEMISKLLQACAQQGSANICRSMGDYVQFSVSQGSARYLPRDQVVDLQSPEAYQLSVLEAVFRNAKAQQHPLTESCCAMLLYHLGYDINFIEGSANNIKILRQEDIAVLTALIRQYG